MVGPVENVLAVRRDDWTGGTGSRTHPLGPSPRHRHSTDSRLIVAWREIEPPAIGGPGGIELAAGIVRNPSGRTAVNVDDPDVPRSNVRQRIKRNPSSVRGPGRRPLPAAGALRQLPRVRSIRAGYPDVHRLGGARR